MIRIIIGFLSILILCCCSENNEIIEEPDSLIIGQWNLSKITNIWNGCTLPAEDITHAYQFNENDTFIKMLSQGDSIVHFNGIYTVTTEDPRFRDSDLMISKFVELSYPSPDDSFFSCGILDAGIEILILTADGFLKNKFQGVCDGNEYYYEKN